MRRALRAMLVVMCLAVMALGSRGASGAQKKDPTIGGSKKSSAPPAARTPRAKAAARSKIIVNANPPDSVVTLDDVTKQPGKDGQLELDVPIGETHELRVYAAADKYAPRTFEIAVTEDESKQLTGKITEKRAVDDPISDFPLLQFEQPVSREEPLKLDVVLPPARAVFMIVNAPVGADVTVDDKKVGAIGPDGSFLGKTAPGRRKISLAAEGYSFVAGESELAAGASLHRINYNLSPEQQRKGAIEITAGVPRSQVLLRLHPKDPNAPTQYVLFASVTARGRALAPNLVPGLYDLFIETPDKQQWEVEGCLVASNKVTAVAYKSGASTPAYRDMDQLAAEINAAQTTPGAPSGAQPNPPASTGAGAGEKPASDAQPAAESLKPPPVPFTLEGDLRSVKISFDDQPEFSLPDNVTDAQQVTGQMADRSATFKLQAQGRSLKLSLEDIGPGAHKIRISKKDFRPWSQEFSATAGQPVALTAKLDPIPWEELVFRWKDATAQGAIRGSPALSISGQQAYVLSESGTLLAYDVTANADTSGRHAPVAQFSVNDSFVGSPLVAPDGTIIVCQSSGMVHGLVERGAALEPKWQPNTEAKGSIVASPALTADGQNIVVGTSVGVVALSLATGARMWRQALDAPVVGAPVTGSDGTVYVLSGAGSLYAIRPDGTMKWPVPYAVPGAEGSASPAIDRRGILYVSAQDGYVHAIRDGGSVGERVWQSGARLGARIDSSPVITASGTILVGSKGALVSALDSTGTVLWSYSKSPSEAETLGGLTLAADGSIYAGLSDGGLLVLKQDGSLKGKFPTKGAVSSAPIITSDGVILFGSADGTVYALKEENGGLSKSAPWPTLQHDEHRSGRAGQK